MWRPEPTLKNGACLKCHISMENLNFLIMKKVSFFPVVFILLCFLFASCSSPIEKDAKKGAEMTWKLEELHKKGNAGDQSAISEAEKLTSELKEFSNEVEKKYTSSEDIAKYKEAFNKYFLEYSGNGETTNDATTKPSGELLAILQNNNFMKGNGLVSLIGLNFTVDNQYSMKLVVIGQGEVVNVRGTYQLIPKGESEAQIILIPGPVQKSQAYNGSDAFDIDVFVASNINYTLRKFVNSDGEKFVKENMILAQTYIDKNIMPLYVLDGSVVFYSEKKLTQAEKDSIDNAKRIEEEKSKALEEKLKGL